MDVFTVRRVGFALAVIVCIPAAQAGTTFDPARNTVLVVGFAKDKPATLVDLRDADAAGKWGIVQYDSATDATTLSAHLWIGAEDGTSSFLRIGGLDHPRESLIMKGDLCVRSPKKKEYGFYEGQNGFLLGLSDNDAVTPTLKFDCIKEGEFGLKADAGTVLQCYRATIAAATPDRKRGWNAAVTTYPAGDLVMINTKLSYFVQLYPFETATGLVRGCTYDHGQFALGNGSGYYEDCTFRDLDVALSDGGCLDVTLVNCRFENNRQNWRLAHTARGIRAVDCFFGEPQVNEVACQPWKNPESGEWQYPLFFAQRHIVVAVKDEAGKPIPRAKATVVHEQGDLSGVAHGVATTGEDGKTSAPGTGKALLLTDYVYRASEDPIRPIEKRYTYTLTVMAEGYASSELKGVDPDQSWAVKEVVLKQKPAG